jgi:GntR family transcriptional regulator, transcriptional repressor for pyruvate dehydrogenase complex
MRDLRADDEARPSASDHLTRRLIDLVRRDGLQPGDRLPSVQSLASRFAVAPPTIRESLRRLQAVGLVEIRHGSGIYLRRGTQRIVLSNPHPGELSTRTAADLIDTRLMIEPGLAARAAQRASDEDIATLRTTLAAAGAHLTGDDDALHRLNMDFHRQVARLAGNTVMSQVIDSLVDVYQAEQRLVLNLYDDRRRDHEGHLAILDALAAHDPGRSQQLMQDHLEGVRAVLEARLPETRPNADS